MDAQVERFRTHPRTAAYPYVWLDATSVKVRQEALGGRAGSMDVVIAVECAVSGEREVLGVDVGPSEGGAFWPAFGVR